MVDYVAAIRREAIGRAPGALLHGGPDQPFAGEQRHLGVVGDGPAAETSSDPKMTQP
jgi:hypothetical protein